MFIRQAEHNKVVEERDQLTQRVQELEARIGTDAQTTAALQEQVSSMTAERTAHEEQVQTLLSQVEEGNARISVLETQVATLTNENKELRELPGAESVREVSTSEAVNGEPMSEIDQATEFCRKNASDINACLQEVEKLNI